MYMLAMVLVQLINQCNLTIVFKCETLVIIVVDGWLIFSNQFLKVNFNHWERLNGLFCFANFF